MPDKTPPILSLLRLFPSLRMATDRESHLLLTADGVLDGLASEQLLVISLGEYGSGGEPAVFQAPGPLSKIREAAGKIHRVLDRARHHGGGTAADSADLTAAGDKLAEGLLPPEMAERLARAASVRLQLARKLLWIPWELAVVGGEHLALRSAVGREISELPLTAQSEPRPRSDVRIALVANPQFNLKEADREADELRQRFALFAGLSAPHIAAHEVRRQEFRHALSQGDWLHYAGHAESPAEEAQRLLLADGPLTPADIAELVGETPPRLVVVNACESARLAETQCAQPGLAEALLAAGTGHYLGTLAPVLDEQGLKFVVRLYEELLGGATVGDALRRARVAAVETAGKASLIWACYVLYGHPQVRLVKATGKADMKSSDDENATPAEEPVKENKENTVEELFRQREERQAEADLAEFQAHLKHEAKVKDLLRQEELRDYESAAEARQWDRKSQETAKEKFYREQAQAARIELEQAALEAELTGARQRLDHELEEAARWGKLGLELEAQESQQRLELESRRMEVLSRASLEALMAAAPDNQRAAILGELAKTQALADRTLAEVLAMAEERSPLVAEAIRERLQGESDPGRIAQQQLMSDQILDAEVEPAVPGVPAEQQQLCRLLDEAVLGGESANDSAAAGERRCPRCDNALPDEANFCNQCGQRLT